MICPIENRVITVHVPVQLAERVDQLAARVGRSKDWIVKEALAAWVNREEERGGLTHAALADVDAGRVIDHQTVQVWADSLSSETPLLVPR